MLPSLVRGGRLESNIAGASVANVDGISSIPGKSELKKCPSNIELKFCRFSTSSL